MTPREWGDYIEAVSGYRPDPPAFSRLKHGKGGKLSTSLWLALRRMEAERDVALAECDKLRLSLRELNALQ